MFSKFDPDRTAWRSRRTGRCYISPASARARQRPFLIYHIPARAGFTFTVDILAAINKVPHFFGLKNTDTNVDPITVAFFERLGAAFDIFAGLELPTLPMLRIGVRGMMITASNVASRMVADDNTFAKGDIDDGIALNLKLYLLFRGVALESSPIPVKYMLKAPRCAENQRASKYHCVGIAGNREAARQVIGRNRADLADCSWTAWARIAGDGFPLFSRAKFMGP